MLRQHRRAHKRPIGAASRLLQWDRAKEDEPKSSSPGTPGSEAGDPEVPDAGRIQVLHRAKTERPNYPRLFAHIFQGTLRTAYKYLSPRRCDMAELLFRSHGCHQEVDLALERVKQGNWLAERAEHRRARVHDDDWLFSRFEVYEERFAG